MREIKILVACEESQAVTKELRRLGHDAYSCDIEPCSGGHPEWHLQQDVIPLLKEKWDMIIAFPPCTYLTNVATRHHSIKFTPLDKINARTQNRIEAMEFFMRFVTADCERIAIENPVGVMNTAYRRPDQIVDPYMFADSAEDLENYVTKATCFWLKNLPPLITNDLPKPDNAERWGRSPKGKAYTWEDTHSKCPTIRSKTFPGVARAMAEQWAGEAQ